MKYHHPIRRRVRQIGRLARAGVIREALLRGRVVPAFWWDGHPTFGDAMTPWLLPRYGVVPLHRRVAEARLIGVGSILEFVPHDYSGAVWGSGLMEERTHPLTAACFLAVRVHHTRDLVGAPADTPLGDPGIHVARHLPPPRLRWEVGVVPHRHHRGNAVLARLVARGGARVRVINVHQGAAAAAREIASCSVIFSSSLHGLVTADSYGIPATWTLLDPPLGGGDFKFRDYESAATPGRSRYLEFDDRLTADDVVRLGRRADADIIASLGDGLAEAIDRLRATAGELGRYPLGLLHMRADRDVRRSP